MMDPCGRGAITGRGNWELAASKKAPMPCKWALQPTGQRFGLEAVKLSDCKLMAVFGFGDHLQAVPKTPINSLFQHAFHRTQTGWTSVLDILRCLPSSQMERYG